MSDRPYATLLWSCSECGTEPIETNSGNLVCEYDGLEFHPKGETGYAELVFGGEGQ